MQPVIMIVEDEASHRRSLEVFVTDRLNMQAFPVSSGREAIDALMGGALPRVDMLLLDWRMPEVSGHDVLLAIRPKFPNLPIIIITASEDVSTAVQAMKDGANDFIIKPFSPERLHVSVKNLLTMSRDSEELSRLKRSHSGNTGWKDIVGSSAIFMASVELGRKAAESAIPVLLLGESGVGKELFASAIHGSSDRAGKPFVAVNCGAIPDNLVESTLFGHEKGAFTGAHTSAAGKFREAAGGTLFLDEIGELKLELQVKLLRALQQKEVQPVGGKEPVKVDVRVISATNQKLEQLVEAGQFREDLFYRLNVFPISIPPLRERGDDIGLLANSIAKSIAAKEHKNVLGVKSDAVEFIQSQPWPGNVRQLENAIFRAVVMSSSNWLEKSDFIFMTSEGLLPKTATMPEIPSVPIVDGNGEVRYYSAIEKDVFSKAVEICDGSFSLAARKLGVGRSTIYRKLDVAAE